jgi:hypothetical protein
MLCCHVIMKHKRYVPDCVCWDGSITPILHRSTVSTATNFYTFDREPHCRSTPRYSANSQAEPVIPMLSTREQPLLCVGVTPAGTQAQAVRLIVLPAIVLAGTAVTRSRGDGCVRTRTASIDTPFIYVVCLKSSVNGPENK